MMHIHLIDCDSTQDVLKEQLRTTTPAQTILVSCENQLKGRGRGDHIWSAMPGTLCMSLSLAAHPVPSFTAIEVSLLCVKFFEQKGEHLLLKWPNDIFNHSQQKCGGILVQTSGDVMMSGMGINLFSESKTFGGVYESSFSVEKKEWCSELAEFILKHRYTDAQSLIRDWEQRSLHMNEAVEIEEAGDIKKGIFVGLGDHGEARLQTASGIVHLYNGSLRRISPISR